MIDIACGHCGVTFKGRRNGKYCSRTCFGKENLTSDKAKWMASFNTGDYRKKPGWAFWKQRGDLPEYKKYRGRVTRLTFKNYNLHKSNINPLDLPRVVNGAEYGYQIDHIKTIRQCFDEGVSVEEAASPDNLRMLPWLENVRRNKNST